MVAKINYLHELMKICIKQGETVPFSAQDSLTFSISDQIQLIGFFSLRVAELLESYVKGSAATCFYIIAAYHFTEP